VITDPCLNARGFTTRRRRYINPLYLYFLNTLSGSWASISSSDPITSYSENADSKNTRYVSPASESRRPSRRAGRGSARKRVPPGVWFNLAIDGRHRWLMLTFLCLLLPQLQGAAARRQQQLKRYASSVFDAVGQWPCRYGLHIQDIATSWELIPACACCRLHVPPVSSYLRLVWRCTTPDLANFVVSYSPTAWNFLFLYVKCSCSNVSLNSVQDFRFRFIDV